MSVKKLNEQNFNTEVLENKGVILVDFYADWCSPCKMLMPIIEQIEKENPEVFVAKVNVDESPALAKEYAVMTIPCLIVFKDGKEATRRVGYLAKDDILLMTKV